MTNDCLLQTWGKNSRIDHGISDKITGPYAFADVAVNTWAHNAAPITLHDGTYAIVHIGSGSGGPNGGKNCNKTGPFEYRDEPTFQTFQEYAASSSAGAGSTIHVSSSLAGPWKPLSPNTLGGCNNPGVNIILSHPPSLLSHPPSLLSHPPSLLSHPPSPS
jgi:hypothetical protein